MRLHFYRFVPFLHHYMQKAVPEAVHQALPTSAVQYAVQQLVQGPSA